MVSFRLTGIGRAAKPAFGAWDAAGDVAGARIETRAVFFAGRFLDTPVLDRSRLPGPGPCSRGRRSSRRMAPPPWCRPIGASGSSNRET